jgi:putative peptide zinc metalloprotease protein
MLCRWHLGFGEALIDDVNANTTLSIDQSDVQRLVVFLQTHCLLTTASPQAVEGLRNMANRAEKGFLTWLIHNYLFFRVPLIKPQRLLETLHRAMRWMFHWPTAVLVSMLSVFGLLLVARQWDHFTATLVDQLSYTGVISFSVALLASKFIHELGHALTATHYGVRVAHMGVAVMVMMPMPYTDTSESWKLHRPRQRLAIAAAGITAEVALAGLATLGWALAGDGALKNALFYLATTGWILTLAINASPFMRFDGYFILADWLDFPNLHERSGALAKTWLRRVLLGWQEPWPEHFSHAKTTALVAFALVTWVYRLVLFIGIAWLVYEYFFKVLGIVLFVVEIAWFIVLPIARELAVWLRRRRDVQSGRVAWGLLTLMALVGLALVPWQTSVTGPAWVHAGQHTVLFAPLPGRLSQLQPAGEVRRGQVLFSLASPDISANERRAQVLADARAKEIKSLTGRDDGEEQRAQLQSEQERFQAEAKGHADELKRLQLVAPFDGVLRDIDEGLAPGVWVHPKQALGILVNPRSWVVDVLVEESDLARVQVGQPAVLRLTRSQHERYPGKVTEIDASRVTNLPHDMLDARFGGAVQTGPVPNSADRHVPVSNLYRVRILLDSPPNLKSLATGSVAIQTQGRAWLPDALKRAYAILIRESGF